MSLTIIVATDRRRGIGLKNTLPWHLAEDLAHFKRTTSGHPIIMGRKTFDSIGRPLPKRRNIVITRNLDWSHDGVEVTHSVDAAAALVGTEKAFVIGGAEIYGMAMSIASRMIVTEIDEAFDCDAFFPPIDPALWQEVTREPAQSETSGLRYAIVTYEKRPQA
jgi:dihydrofolate reductase